MRKKGRNAVLATVCVTNNKNKGLLALKPGKPEMTGDSHGWVELLKGLTGG